MITEKTIYVTESGMRFDEQKNAKAYDDDYMLLRYMYDQCLGMPLPVPGIGEGYCLETRHHSKQSIDQIMSTVMHIIHKHVLTYEKYNDEFKNLFDKLTSGITSLSGYENEDDIRRTFNNIIRTIEILLHYYSFNDEYYQEHYNHALIFKTVRRLKNTSYVTGIEYPANSVHNWVFSEDKWEDFVQHEKEYIAQGGKYR